MLAIIWSSVRSIRPEVFLENGVLKICSKFTGQHPFRSAISIKLLSNFIEITLRNEFSTVNLLHIFRTTFYKNTSEWLLLFCVLIQSQKQKRIQSQIKYILVPTRCCSSFIRIAIFILICFDGVILIVPKYWSKVKGSSFRDFCNSWT